MRHATVTVTPLPTPRKRNATAGSARSLQKGQQTRAVILEAVHLK